MKTLEELNTEYVLERKSFKLLERIHMEKITEIKNYVIKHAKYKIGEKVFYIEKTRNDSPVIKTPGITRYL
jgi:hypothetical protein